MDDRATLEAESGSNQGNVNTGCQYVRVCSARGIFDFRNENATGDAFLEPGPVSSAGDVLLHRTF